MHVVKLSSLSSVLFSSSACLCSWLETVSLSDDGCSGGDVMRLRDSIIRLEVIVVIFLRVRMFRNVDSDVCNVSAMRSHVILSFSCDGIMIIRACSMSSAGCKLNIFAACVRAFLVLSSCVFPCSLNEP